MGPRRLLALALLIGPACSPTVVGAPDPADWRSFTVHYGLLVDREIQRRELRVDDAAVLETLRERHGSLGVTPSVCSCEVVNWIDVGLEGGESEAWHFCGDAAHVMGPGGEQLTNRGLYYGLRSIVEQREATRGVSLIAQDEDLGR